MHDAISSYRGNRPTHKHTHPQTDRTDYNTLRRSYSAQCNNATAELIESGFHTLRLEPNRDRTFNRREAITKRFLPLVT